MTPKQAQEHSHGNALAPPPLGNPPRILPRAADITLDPRDRPACRRPSARRRSVFRSRLVTVLSVPAAHSGIVPGVTLLMPLIRVAVRNTHTHLGWCGNIPRKPAIFMFECARPRPPFGRVHPTPSRYQLRRRRHPPWRRLANGRTPGFTVAEGCDSPRPPCRGRFRVRPSTREGAARSESTVMVEADLPRVSGWP